MDDNGNPETIEYYQDMSDRELMERVARNTDQLIGFCAGLSDQLANLDIPSLIGGLLGGSGDAAPNPMAAILGSLIK